AEDGIRDFHVTGVQTCALPIFRQRCAYRGGKRPGNPARLDRPCHGQLLFTCAGKICRARTGERREGAPWHARVHLRPAEKAVRRSEERRGGKEWRSRGGGGRSE